MNEPHIHVGIMRRFHGLNGARTEITINLSGIPATASSELIDLMMGTADVAVDRLLQEVETRARAAAPGPKPEINPEAFGVTAQRAPDTIPLGDRIDQTVRNLIGGDVPPPAPAVDQVTGEVLGTADTVPVDVLPALSPELQAELSRIEGELERGDTVAMSQELRAQLVTAAAESILSPEPTTDPVSDEILSLLGEAIADAAFDLAVATPGAIDTEPEGEEEEVFDLYVPPAAPPRDDEVLAGGTAFGIHVPYPPLEWSSEQLSTVGVDGGSGQLTAVNAAISNLGYGGRLRHPACLAILQAYGPFNDRPAPDSIESVYDLSKAQAHVILEWIEKSASTPLALRDLAAAVHIIRISKETPKTHV